MFLTYLFLHRMVTSTGPFVCRPVHTPSGRAVGITLHLGATPFHNAVTGKIVCNGESEESVTQTRLLPSMYCPTGLGGNLEGVKDMIEEICSASTIPQDGIQGAINATQPIASRRSRFRSATDLAFAYHARPQ